MCALGSERERERFLNLVNIIYLEISEVEYEMIEMIEIH